MLRLARTCGISTADSRLETVAGKDVLLIKRFDRERTDAGYLRARMMSALTVLRAEEDATIRVHWSYVVLAEEFRRIVAEPNKDTRELLRRMCFNALIPISTTIPATMRLLPRSSTGPSRPHTIKTKTSVVPGGGLGLGIRPLPSSRHFF